VDEPEIGLSFVDVKEADGARAAIKAMNETRRVLHDLTSDALVHERSKRRSEGETLERFVGVVSAILV
jgi:hypothetical protein